MKSLHIDLTNCHGIHKLSPVLPFSKNNATAIYAPNGMMKTSFARTFADLSSGVESADRMFPDRVSKRAITDDQGTPIEADDVVVVGVTHLRGSHLAWS